MQFSIEGSALLEGLNVVTRALAARPAKQILEGVMVNAADDELTIACSDGSLTIEADLMGVIEKSGSAVMPGKLFTEMIRKLPDGNVNIQTSENKASLRCMSYRSNLSCMSAEEYPDMPVIHGQISLHIPQKRLKEMISRVVFAIATDETRQLLTGCLVEITAKELRIIALDGFRMAIQKTPGSFELPEGKDKLRVVVPGRVMSELSKVLPDSDENCEVVLDSGRMQVRFGNIRLSCVLLSGEYIDYNRILPTLFSTNAKVNRIALNNAIDRASLMAREGKNNLIRMSFTEEQVVVSSNAEMGDVREELAAQMQGNPMEIAFNAKYVVDAMRSISDDELVMKFNSSVSPCVIAPVEGEEFLYLILPVRVFQ